MALSVATNAQQVEVNYNRNHNFANYHTCVWASNNENQIQNSILAQTAKQDIASALQSKGLQRVEENQNSDLLVLANGGMRQQTSYSATGMRVIGGGFGAISPEQSQQGTLIVDLH